VIQDIKTLGVKNWRNLPVEKESWQKPSEEGQGPRRAVDPMMMMIMMVFLVVKGLVSKKTYVFSKITCSKVSSITIPKKCHITVASLGITC
jgi:hypothetical protein